MTYCRTQIFLLSVMFLVACQPKEQDPAQSPSVIQAEILKVLQLDPVLFSDELPIARQQHLLAVNIEKHNRLVNQLAKLEANRTVSSLRKLETENINAKLTLVALDRVQNPLVHARIMGRYLLGPPSDTVKQSAPPLDPNDVNEQARLAWESVLLLPYGYEALPGYLETALEALARIGNPASVPVLVLFANRVNKLLPAQHSIIQSHYELVAKTLLRIPSVESAQALQDIYQQSKQFRSHDYPFAADWPEADFYAFFDDSAQQLSQQWLELSERYPEQPLFMGIRQRINERALP